MKKKFIVIHLETKSREFSSRLILSYHLLQNNFGVIISDKILNPYYIDLYPSDCRRAVTK